MENEWQQGGPRVCLSVCVCLCVGVSVCACLAMLQVVNDPGDGLLSCGADITLQKNDRSVSTGMKKHAQTHNVSKHPALVLSVIVQTHSVV